MAFKRATKEQSKLRLAIFGPSGAGKTFTALRIAAGLGGTVAVIDSERGSASKYSDRFEFDVCDLTDKRIAGYVEQIREAGRAGYAVLIIDSLSHAWQELLEEVDRLAASPKFKGNSWGAWSEGTPKQRALVDTILAYPGHVIATMRSKTEWTTTKDSRGKSAPERVGLAPEQGKGIEYEFDLLLELSEEHYGRILKDRTGKFQDAILERPGEDFGRELAAWLADGVVPAPSVVRDLQTAIDRIPPTVGGKPVTDRHRMGAPKVEPPAEAHGAYLQALAKQHGWTGKTVKPMRESYGFDSLDAVDIDHADEIAAILAAGPQAWDDARYLEEHPPEPNEADWLTTAADVGWTPAAALRLIRGWTGTPEAMGAAIDAGPAAGEGSR